MNDKQRHFLAIKEGLNSPFWRYVKNYLQEQARQVGDLGIQLVPGSLSEQVEREQLFGKAKALIELVDQIPNTIDDTMKELGNDEHENTQEAS